MANAMTLRVERQQRQRGAKANRRDPPSRALAKAKRRKGQRRDPPVQAPAKAKRSYVLPPRPSKPSASEGTLKPEVQSQPGKPPPHSSDARRQKALRGTQAESVPRGALGATREKGAAATLCSGRTNAGAPRAPRGTDSACVPHVCPKLAARICPHLRYNR